MFHSSKALGVGELGSWDIGEEVAGEEFAAKLHQAYGAEEHAPGEFPRFSSEQFAEKDAIAIDQYSDTFFLGFFLLDSGWRCILKGGEAVPVALAGDGSGGVPSGAMP